MARKPPPPVGPEIAVGDWVLIGHQMWNEPQHWWIAPVEWVGPQLVLVPYLQGTNGDGAPALIERRHIEAVGSRNAVQATFLAACAAARKHEGAIRTATLALTVARDAQAKAVAEACHPLRTVEVGQ